MGVKIITLIPVAFCLLTSCAQMERGSSMGIDAITQSPKTIADHEVLARHYVNEVKILLAKIQDQKVLVEKYAEESNRYGQESEKVIVNTHRFLRGYNENYFFAQRAEDNKLKSLNLIRSYEKAVEENMSRAAVHWKVVRESK